MERKIWETEKAKVLSCCGEEGWWMVLRFSVILGVEDGSELLGVRLGGGWS